MAETSLYARVGGLRSSSPWSHASTKASPPTPCSAAALPRARPRSGPRRLALVPVQYWGGPGTYRDERGHPRLRMRHPPFAIGQPERDRWLKHMCAAIDEVAGGDPEAAAALHGYVTMAAEAMQNRA